MRPMGRILALCGWLAWQLGRPFRATPLRRLGRAAVFAVATLLLVAAAVPVALPLLDPQPEDATVQQVFDGAIAHGDGWLRLRGRITRLRQSPIGEPGSFALLVDAANPLRAIVLESSSRPEPVEITDVTGTLTSSSVTVEEELPIEARVAGTPPRVVPDQLLRLDSAPKAARSILWPLAIPPLLIAAMLLIGAHSGYPIFRPTSEIDVLATPLSPGERVPSAYGGRIGPHRADLADPAGALLLLRRAPTGNLLTAQPLADDDGPAPPPVLISGSWTSGTIGTVHTVREAVAALQVRSELVDAIFLFARTAERDRVAAMMAVDR